MLDKFVLQTFANVFGWAYFISWTVSFYPQTIMNFRMKSVAGFSLDFVAFNLLGYFGYSIFTCTLYWNNTVRQEYVNFEHTKHRDVPVEANDVAFAVHGLFITTVQVFQCMIYDKGSQKVSYLTMFLVTTGVFTLIGTLIVCQLALVEWLWLANVAGYVKLSMSLIKCLPQVYLNYRRKSTKGYSILGVSQDFAGGGFSVMQQIMYSLINKDNKEITGNIPKLFLAWQSLIIDAIFFWQHYVFYFENIPAEEVSKEA